MTGAERLRAVVVLVVLCGAGGAAADDRLDAGVAAWLERMNLSVRTLDYEGRFVYQHGDHLEALFLHHSVHEGRERERLVALNGAEREVRRDEDKAICSSSEQRELLVDRGSGGRSFSPLLPIHLDQLSGHYRFALGGETRVAGRTARELLIEPLDALRYGYRLSLDTEHALPLRTLVLGADGRKVSQIMFTELKVGMPSAPVEPLWPETGAAPTDPPLALLETQSSAELDRESWMKPPRWSFADTPHGFVLNMHRRYRTDPKAEVEHFIFSDGLATVSVYVEPEQGSGLRGLASIGPVSAYGVSIDGHQVTAVGEVPGETVRLFGEAVVPRADARP